MADAVLLPGYPPASAVLPTLLTDRQVAAIVNVSVVTVRRWRLHDTGPPHIKIDRSVRYRPADVAAWLANYPARPKTSNIKKRRSPIGERPAHEWAQWKQRYGLAINPGSNSGCAGYPCGRTSSQRLRKSFGPRNPSPPPNRRTGCRLHRAEQGSRSTHDRGPETADC